MLLLHYQYNVFSPFITKSPDITIFNTDALVCHDSPMKVARSNQNVWKIAITLEPSGKCIL